MIPASSHPNARRADRADRKETRHVDQARPCSRTRPERMTLLRALPIRRLSSGEGRVFALVSAARGPKVTPQRPPALFSSRYRTAGTVRAGRSVAADLARVRAVGHTKPRALRAVVPVVAPDAAQGDAQRLHAWTSTAHAVELPGHLTASRPSRDASNPHVQSVMQELADAKLEDEPQIGG